MFGVEVDGLDGWRELTSRLGGAVRKRPQNCRAQLWRSIHAQHGHNADRRWRALDEVILFFFFLALPGWGIMFKVKREGLVSLTTYPRHLSRGGQLGTTGISDPASAELSCCSWGSARRLAGSTWEGMPLEGEGHPVLRRTLGDEGKILSAFFFGEDGGQGRREKKKLGGQGWRSTSERKEAGTE
jgi:hypothetical protein